MGQDHDARHAAKKKRKRIAEGDEQPRRQRKSKNRVLLRMLPKLLLGPMPPKLRAAISMLLIMLPVSAALPPPGPLGRQPVHASSRTASEVLSQYLIVSQSTHELAHLQVRRLCRGVCFQPPGLAPQDKEWAPGAGGGASNAEAKMAAPVSSEQQPPAKKRRRQKGKQEGDGLRQSTAVNLLDRKALGKAAAGREGEPASALAGFVMVLSCTQALQHSRATVKETQHGQKQRRSLQVTRQALYRVSCTQALRHIKATVKETNREGNREGYRR